MRKSIAFYKGVSFVIVGAASYGILATVVKLAYTDGFSTAEVIISQYSLGLLAVGGLVLLNSKSEINNFRKGVDKQSILKLIVGGTSYGLTGVCYYFAVKYIPVSICIILLMQTIWMGILLESITMRKLPRGEQLIALVLILAGTILATNAIGNYSSLDLRGVGWGFGAAVMYTVSLFVSNRVGLDLSVYYRSFWILSGGCAAVFLTSGFIASGSFNFGIFWKWGIILALFGTVLPPILLNKGLPRIGIGLGSILIAIEIPVSVSMAYFILHENVLVSQWLGIGLILGSIIMINMRKLTTELNKDRIKVLRQYD